jgi:hypothetical protein
LPLGDKPLEAALPAVELVAASELADDADAVPAADEA